MEFIERTSQFEKMIDNKIIGMPSLIDTKINFRGKNNILVCDNAIKLENVVLEFKGDNSIVYLGSNLNKYFRLTIYNNSTVFLGKDSNIGYSINLNIGECQNLVIGDDCVIDDDVSIHTFDKYSIYNNTSKNRFNFSNSVYIGDHVWIGEKSFISKGVKIGSGTIIDNCSFIPANANVPSNLFLSGNPAKIIRKDVFFTKSFTGIFRADDSLNSKDYKSNVFIYEIVSEETLSLNNIENIFNELSVESRLEFIQKLFVQNKRKNRFSM